MINTPASTPSTPAPKTPASSEISTPSLEPERNLEAESELFAGALQNTPAPSSATPEYEPAPSQTYSNLPFSLEQIESAAKSSPELPENVPAPPPKPEREPAPSQPHSNFPFSSDQVESTPTISAPESLENASNFSPPKPEREPAPSQPHNNFPLPPNQTKPAPTISESDESLRNVRANIKEAEEASVISNTPFLNDADPVYADAPPQTSFNNVRVRPESPIENTIAPRVPQPPAAHMDHRPHSATRIATESSEKTRNVAAPFSPDKAEGAPQLANQNFSANAGNPPAVIPHEAPTTPATPNLSFASPSPAPNTSTAAPLEPPTTVGETPQTPSVVSSPPATSVDGLQFNAPLANPPSGSSSTTSPEDIALSLEESPSLKPAEFDLEPPFRPTQPPSAPTPIGDAILQNMQPTAHWENTPVEIRLDFLAAEVAERILVSDPAASGPAEVRIAVKESILPGVEVRIIQDQGRMQVQLITSSDSSYQFLNQHHAALQEHLDQRLGDRGISVELQMSSDSQGRSRNRYEYVQPEEE